MALRLSAPAPDSAAAPSSDTHRFVANPAALVTGLRDDARTALAARDVQAFSALFARADAIEDIHRRHQARLVLLEAGMHDAPAEAAVLSAAMAVVARRSVEWLEAEPREPSILNLAGVAFYELGELGAAEHLFKAASRLDPGLPHVAGNLEELTRRRRARAPQPALPPAVRAALRDLAPRGKRVANAARPAEGLTLSLCMIVKDEEEMLPRCLAAIRDHVDELVVVDTGSTDRTREIALEHGAKLIDVAWTGSFSDARNVSFAAATGDWLMFLDADEVLVEGDGERLRALTGQTWREAHYLLETNHTGTLEDGTAVTHNALRVFRNRPGLRFEGRIHEQIAQHLPAFLPERLAVSDVRIDHYGYLGAVRDAKEKSRRNIELLERQAAEGLDTPFLAFNLGSEYAAAGDNEAALVQLESSWSRLAGESNLASYGFVPSLAGRLVRALRVTGDLRGARTRGAEVLTRFPGFTDVLLEMAIAAAALGDHETAIAELERCLEWGDAPSTYSATQGSGTFLAMATLADARRATGDLQGAEELLRRCRAEYPVFAGAIEPLTRLMLAQGRTPQETVQAVAGDAELALSSRFLLAAALHESGAPEAAEEQLRLVIAAQPDAAPARVALGEALLSQSRFAEAAEAARAVDAESPWAPAAARTAAFGLMAGEAGEDRLRDTLAWGRAAGLPEGELRALQAWADARRGVMPPPAGVPSTGAALTLTMLEALLRLEAFELFGTLLPVAEALALPSRDRHELLARMYLRRGFLESAGDEWIAAVQEDGPDAAALGGLAEVAAARGLDEDAELLAQEARALAAR
jgi:tetratricopeptide (TPR) repeat protein